MGQRSGVPHLPAVTLSVRPVRRVRVRYRLLGSADRGQQRLLGRRRQTAPYASSPAFPSRRLILSRSYPAHPVNLAIRELAEGHLN